MTWLALRVLVWMFLLQNPNDPNLRLDPAWAASYLETAQEIANEAEADPLLGDVEETAGLLVAWAQKESRFKRDAVGDGGRSRGLLQVSTHWGDTSVHGALRLMHESFRVCAGRPLTERMGWYAYGGAGCTHRLELSRARMTAAHALVRRHAPALDALDAAWRNSLETGV